MDLRDILTVCGLVMIGAGLWWIYPPACLIGVGALLFWAGTRPQKAVK